MQSAFIAQPAVTCPTPEKPQITPRGQRNYLFIVFGEYPCSFVMGFPKQDPVSRELCGILSHSNLCLVLGFFVFFFFFKSISEESKAKLWNKELSSGEVRGSQAIWKENLCSFKREKFEQHKSKEIKILKMHLIF